MDDYLSIVIILIFLIVVTFTTGYANGSQETELKTIKYCIEQQAKCKVKYDYIKLGETK